MRTIKKYDKNRKNVMYGSKLFVVCKLPNCKCYIYTKKLYIYRLYFVPFFLKKTKKKPSKFHYKYGI